MAAVISAGVRMAEGGGPERAGAGAPELSSGGGPEVTGSVRAAEVDDDMIETGRADTKLVESRDLPGRLRRL